jgi:hypothetical protein
MDFNMNRGSQSAPSRPAASSTSAASANGGGKSSKSGLKGGPAWLRVVWLVLLFSITILVVAIAILLYNGGTKQSNYVDKDKQQAVFLTNGQVYFGKIKDVNSQYIDLRNIYYLNVNQQVQPDQKDDKNKEASNAQNSISLVKLGCELHGPADQMIINRDQITFWENLKDDGQVAKAIAQWVEQNPDGQKCATTTNNNSSDTETNKP